MPSWSPVIPTDSSDTGHFIFDRKVTDNYVVKHAPATSNALLSITGATLIAESASHFVRQPFKTAMRALTGSVQADAGMTGVAHYALKFSKEPNLHNALGIIASGLFAAEGAFRFIEAEKTHLMRTSAFGFGAALTKCVNGGPLTTIPYGLDAIWNGAEWAHGLSPEARKGMLGLAHELTHRWRTGDLAKAQRNVGMVMIGIAALKTLLLAADRGPKEARVAAFEQQVDRAYDAVQSEVTVRHLEEWERALRTAEGESDEVVQTKLEEFFEALHRGAPSPAHKFAHVLETSPIEGASLIRRFPGPAAQAVRDLRSAAPGAYAALRTRYRVDTAFGAQP